MRMTSKLLQSILFLLGTWMLPIGGSVEVLNSTDYLVEDRLLQPTLPAAHVYVPGLQSVKENGMILSNGLKSRLIARTFRRVKLEKSNITGIDPILIRYSVDTFHSLPDGAACFVEPNPIDPYRPNYKYVSNSENPIRGGVGAVEFDFDGKVIGYEMITRRTRWNCGGGRTFYNTWITCEELDGGQIWEIIPYPKNEFERKNRVRKTALGFGSFGYYEAVAVDYTKPTMPRVYVTTDREDGPIIRYTPSSYATQWAIKNKNYSQLFYNDTIPEEKKDADYRPAKWDYLIMVEDTNKFAWTQNLTAARKNAELNHKNCEGIDIKSGILYFTCKKEKFLFTLDLAKGTYEKTSTAGGAFDGQPDQIAWVLEADGTVREEIDEDEILYMAEDVKVVNRSNDGATQMGGIFGRNRKGEIFPIVQGNTWRGEASGLAFSPGNKFMYFTFQQMGRLYEVSRIDKKPFHGSQIDIQYHNGDKAEEVRK